MKNLYLLICAVLCLSICGCFKDDCKSVHRIYKPVYKTLTKVRTEIKGEAPQPIQSTGKICLYNNLIFLNEPGKGIHVIDNSNPEHPDNIAFINVPGNIDVAVKDNYLYADSYSDLVVFDISNPLNITAKEFKNNIFPQTMYYYADGQSHPFASNYNPDSILVPVDFIAYDTIVDCETYDRWLGDDVIYTASSQKYYTAVPSQHVGINGSESRFTILNNFLYTVDNAMLHSFDITNAASPQLANDTGIVSAGAIQTIFSLEDKLFIGSSNGISIYSVANPLLPSYVGMFGHIPLCDPVIADKNYAYSTVFSGSTCGGGDANELDILDITTDITNPTLIKAYNLTNPHGLAKDDNILFICDGADGLKVFDASDVNNLALKQHISGLETFDVIAYNNIAFVTAKGGLYEYDYSNTFNLKLLSKISIQ